MNHIEKALALLGEVDDSITENGGDEREHHELKLIRRAMGHLKKVGTVPARRKHVEALQQIRAYCYNATPETAPAVVLSCIRIAEGVL